MTKAESASGTVTRVGEPPADGGAPLAPPPPATAPRPGRVWLAAGAAALIASLLTLAAGWWVLDRFLLPPRLAENAAAPAARMAGLEARLADLDQRLAGLDTRPDIPDAVQDELDRLRAEMDRQPEALPALVGNLRTLSGRVDAAAAEDQRLAGALADLAGQDAALAARLDAQDDREGRVLQRLAALEAAPDRNRAALAAILWLARAADAAEPFPGPLRALVAATGAEPTPALVAAAEHGVPGRGVLLARLPGAARAAAREAAIAPGADPEEGVAPALLAPLFAWLRGLVTVERTGAAATPGPFADLLAIPPDAGSEGLQAALALIRQLPDPVRVGMAGWARDAERRVALDAEVAGWLDAILGDRG